MADISSEGGTVPPNQIVKLSVTATLEDGTTRTLEFSHPCDDVRMELNMGTLAPHEVELSQQGYRKYRLIAFAATSDETDIVYADTTPLGQSIG
jgi:hypothetical protein